MFIVIFLFVLISYVDSEKENPIKDVKESLMVGVDTIRDPKQMGIDKDTIITRNMKLGKRNLGKNSRDKKKQEHEPDWSYSSFPKELSAHVEQFKLNMTECLKEVESKGQKGVQRLSPKKDSPIHGDCLIACVLKRNGVIQHGKIHKGNLLSLVNKFYAKDAQLMKKLEKQVDRCIDRSSRLNNDCTLAAQLNDCTNQIMSNNKHTIVVNY